MPALVVPFTKMHGAGNDFVVLDNRFFHFSAAELADLARRVCPRRFGVGADGLLALSPPREDGHDYRMDYLNADGTRAGMCGNGARCLARFARSAGLTAEPLTFGSDAGTYRAAVPADPAAPVRLFVPPPERYREAVPTEGADEPAYIWTGTDHAVLFVPAAEAAPVGEAGPRLRRDPAFQPAGANVDFVEVLNPDPARLRVRTFEKGVEAETLACGTGALAAALVARLAGRVRGEAVAVEMPGGTLRVGFRLGGDGAAGVRDLWLEGPAEVVYQGTLEV
ncbi:MAG: diaminopimelate epimerase [Rhodothermales bacterium]|nr:diaminopimelate epimerase [Rhodothermales bacterium]